MLIGAPVL